MKFLSVCSGIEAASVAWNPLGWKATAFSEIEPFPCSVLAHHYPDTPNRGDMTKYKDWPDDSIDLLCGGTPCQSFSVAGLRKGLDDPRGNLMLAFGAIAAKYRPRWLVWENVPGVLSSNGGRDFGSFLGLLGVLGYGFAYRVLDAQYAGLAQRRRRVFVVGCLGDWRSAAAVLFERHSLQGHPAPRRETGKEVARPIAAGSTGSGGYRNDADTADNLIAGVIRATQGGSDVDHARAGHLIAGTLTARAGRNGGMSNDDIDAGRIVAFGGGANCQETDVATALHAHPGGSRLDFQTETFVTHSLRGEGLDASEDGSGRGTPLVPVALSHQGGGTQTTLGYDPASGTAPCLSKSQTSAIVGMQVRRLTPRECERLQGFPDNYTLIPHRGKPAADGPRYKALGNSWAVPVVRWIGERIAAVDAIRIQERVIQA